MRKTYIRFVSICILVLFLLSGCSEPLPADDGEYQRKKEECIQWIIDNKESIDVIVQQLDTYDFGISVYCNDGAFKVNVRTSGTEKPSAYPVLSNDELMENLRILFENEYIHSIVKSKAKDENDYSYTIFFVTIKRAFTCFAYLANTPEEALGADEHIIGDWYYKIRMYE
ncbi:MAG: hypothetical protein J6L81_04315 [Clostridia bacterium]|nr:hypothetical protein [Clostridia bacterium]